MIAQNVEEIKNLCEMYQMYQEITRRLTNGSPFTTPSTTWQGYERLALVDDINIGLDYTSSKGLYLMANNRTHSLASLHVADRRGRGDYEGHITPQSFALFAKDAFGLDNATANLLAAYISAETAHGITCNGSIERALMLTAGGYVEDNPAGGYLVRSQTDANKKYFVGKSPYGHWGCDCQDNLDGSPKIDGNRVCKHVMAVWLSVKASLFTTDAPPAQRNGRYAVCPRCKLPWQQCGCNGSGSLPEPARVTRFDNLDKPLTVAEQRQAARNANGIRQEARRRTASQFTNVQRWR